MPKRPDNRFSIAEPRPMSAGVVELLSGIVRRRPLSGEEALREEARIEAAARAGDPDAQAKFARRLLTDQPNARKNRQALRLLRRAAAKNHPEALHLLGLAYMRGQGAAQDMKKGADLIERAAYLGEKGAEEDIAKAYRLGLGREQSFAKSLYWARLAGAAGSGPAALWAGLALRDGLGQPNSEPDFDEARKWLAAAAKLNAEGAAQALAKLHQDRRYENRDPMEARRWTNEAALLGDLEAQYRIGIFSWSGAGGSVNLREAVRWLCRAAQGGHAQAVSMLAGFFMTGNALPMNRLSAWVLFRLAETLGDASSKGTAQAVAGSLSPKERQEGRKILALKTPKAILERVVPLKSR